MFLAFVDQKLCPKHNKINHTSRAGLWIYRTWISAKNQQFSVASSTP